MKGPRNSAIAALAVALGIGLLSPGSAVASTDPVAASPKQPDYDELLAQQEIDRNSFDHERNLMISMRDGIRLSTDVFRRKSGDSQPVILIRTPYEKSFEGNPALIALYLKNGYAVVLQNERGLHGSEGEHRFLAGARQDGWDTLNWIAQQPWSNRRVGMVGCSSSAENQLALASSGHPLLNTIVPMAAGAGIGTKGGVTSQGAFYRGGVPLLSAWTGWYAEKHNVILKEEDLWHLPSGDILRHAGIPNTSYEKFMALSPTSPQWRDTDFLNDTDQIRIPVLNINSWYDVGAAETLKFYSAQSKSADNSYLVMAPGPHCSFFLDLFYTADRTPITPEGRAPVVHAAQMDYLGLIIDWLDHWLKDKPNRIASMPKVQVFLPGAQRWIQSTSWPLPNTKHRTLFLTADNRLSVDQPRTDSATAFASDPSKPVPSIGDLCCSDNVGMPQNDIESRSDVITFTTQPLTDPTNLLGVIKVQLYVSTSVPDADLAVKLTAVDQAGVSRVLSETMMRLRYRNGFAQEALMPIDTLQPVSLDGLVTAKQLASGERIRVQIAGSNFPSFERNLQTGGVNCKATQPRVGTIRIHSGPGHLSRLELPIVQ